MTEWQDISTAPKDGHARLVWAPANQNIYLVSWVDTTDDRDGPGWSIFGAYRHILHEPITHWQPLPDPPEDSRTPK